MAKKITITIYPSAPSEVIYGALTLAGAGGLPIPLGETTISDAGGTNLIVYGGLVVPGTGGGVLSGSVTFGNGAQWTVTALADNYSVRDKAEAIASINDAGLTTGKTVRFRPGNYAGHNAGSGVGSFFHFVNPANVVTITGDDKSTMVFEGLYLSRCSNLVVRDLTVRPGLDGKLVNLYNATTNVTFDGLDVAGNNPIDPSGDYSAAQPDVPSGGIGVASFGFKRDIFIRNCEIKWTLKGIAGSPDAGVFEISGNYLHDIYADFIELGVGGDKTFTLNIFDNTLMGKICKSSDAGNPHGDFIQLKAFDATEAGVENINIERNIIVNNYNNSSPAGLFLSNIPNGRFYTGTRICGNLIVRNGGPGETDIQIYHARDCVVIGNTVVSVDYSGSGTATTGARIEVGNNESAGTNIVKNNAADGFNLAAGTVDTNNIALGAQGETTAYSTAFVGPTFMPTTREEALAVFAMRQGGPLDLATDVGAVGNGYVTFPSAAPGGGGSLDPAFE